MSPQKLLNFEEAFSDHCGTCRLTCECGKTYFYDYNAGYSWEEGEFEKLKAGAGVPVDGFIGGVDFEGRHYAQCCTCWHKRAEQAIGFIDGHAHQIADYLTREKQRKQRDADTAPIVGTPERPQDSAAGNPQL